MPALHARALAVWDSVQSSYWFLPSIMTAAAAALSVGLVRLDIAVGSGWIAELDWLYGNRPEGARAVLSTIAGSMLSVAGVTFSITIASVVYASGQYGPRLLSNFMSDRGNQVTLGTFIATALYSLLVLRSIRSESARVGAGAGEEFVPDIAILTALGLTLASVGVFIFFIHHVPESIHVSNVIAGVGRDLQEKTDTLFPARIGRAGPDPPGDGRALPDDFDEDAACVTAPESGYLKGVDARDLLRAASEHDLVVRVGRRPGDFVSAGDTLALAWPAERATDEVCGRLLKAFAWGRQRSARQDVHFLVNELVEIAARALSPGVNDPFTATSCLDWLGAMLKGLAGRDFPTALRYDDAGALRVVTHPTTFAEFVEAVFGQLRPYVSADRNAALHALLVISEVAGRTTRDDQRDALRDQADAILDGAEAELQIEADLDLIRARHRTVVRLLDGSLSHNEARDRTDWVGGTA